MKIPPFDLPIQQRQTPEGPSLRSAKGDNVAECYTEAGADYLERAVNSYADLVSTLEFNVEECELWLKTSSVAELRQTLRNILAASQNTLAKATQP